MVSTTVYALLAINKRRLQTLSNGIVVTSQATTFELGIIKNTPLILT